jgi:hypothetical protein
MSCLTAVRAALHTRLVQLLVGEFEWLVYAVCGRSLALQLEQLIAIGQLVNELNNASTVGRVFDGVRKTVRGGGAEVGEESIVIAV